MRIGRLFGLLACITLGAVLLVAQGVHGINWTWLPVTADVAGNTIAVDGYNLSCGAPAGPFIKVNSALIPSNTFLQTGLTVGNSYACKVTAVKSGNESAQSAASSPVLFTFPPVAPGAPAGAVQ